MTMKIRVNEGDQTIIPATPADEFVAPNDFIARLVDRAKVSGRATEIDAEGMEVTAIVSDD